MELDLQVLYTLVFGAHFVIIRSLSHAACNVQVDWLGQKNQIDAGESLFFRVEQTAELLLEQQGLY